MSKEELSDTRECVHCKALTVFTVQKVIVGDNYMTHMEVPMCTTCRKAYDEGYKDGLDDS